MTKPDQNPEHIEPILQRVLDDILRKEIEAKKKKTQRS